MTEIQTKSSKQSFISSRDGLGEFLRTIAAICAISLALVAGSFHVRGIQDHIDVQEKPSGAINSGLITSKETERSQHSKYLIHKHTSATENHQSADSKLVKPTKYLLFLFLELRTLSDRQQRSNKGAIKIDKPGQISLSHGPWLKAQAIDSFKRNFGKT